MQISGERSNNLLILRTTPSGRLYFYTGKRHTEQLGKVWSIDRSRACKFPAELAAEVAEQADSIPRQPADRVFVLCEGLFDNIIRWEYDNRSRQRRIHRAMRKVTHAR